jgi:hypothetical protein
MTTYTDIYVRDNFGDTGVVPSTGNACASPDLIPLQGGTLGWPQAANTYNGPDLGKPIVNGGVNNLYVRAKNLGTAPSSGTVSLLYSKASLLLLPPWTAISTPGGAPTATLLDANQSSTIAGGTICLSNPAFQLSGLPVTNDHYCLISIVQTPRNPVTVPPSFASNGAFVQWVQNQPAVGWRNVSLVPNGQTQVTRIYVFGSTNPGSAYFHFKIQGRGYQANTPVTVQNADAICPIQWSGTLPAPDINGNQIAGFDVPVPGNYSGNITLTLTSPGGPFPGGATLSTTYYQYPSSGDSLHDEVGRFAEVARMTPDGGRAQFNAFLIPLGECNLIVAGSGAARSRRSQQR